MVKVWASLLTAAGSVAAVTIAEINGNRFMSSMNGSDVKGLEGLVTAVSNAGIYLRSTKPDKDKTTSEGLYVFGSGAKNGVAVGDVVTLDGKVTEYRSNKDYLYLTELISPTNIVVKSSSNEFKPLVIGKDTYSPPNKDFSKLDGGDIFAVPNAVSRVSDVNPTLEPKKYGLDFWESIVGELVTVQKAVAVSRPNKFGDVWVKGDWRTTGKNKQGGVTMLDRDANPETITIGSPLDGTKNPSDTKMGDSYGDITGIVTYAFGFYRILPLTAPKPTARSSADFPAVKFQSKGSCAGITIGDYNAENLSPESTHLPAVADQIVHKLKTPDLLFLQEIQDNSGPANDGIVSANVTLSALSAKIEQVSGVVYDFAEVAPVDNQDGGQPGGNIRQTFLYRPDALQLVDPNEGAATDDNEVLDGPKLKFNPGRIAPGNDAWKDSRKPLVAMWKPVKGNGKPFFTINVHFTSKGGSTSLHGDARPPVNKGVEKRTAQSEITAEFIAQILKKDPSAQIITAGDFNDFTQVASLQAFTNKSTLVELDELVKIPAEERYTYLFDMNSQALDHMFVSKSLGKGAKYEHLHLNTWQNFDDQVSDHDPSVARFDLCQ